MAGAGRQHRHIAGLDIELLAILPPKRTRALPAAMPSTSWICE